MIGLLMRLGLGLAALALAVGHGHAEARPISHDEYIESRDLFSGLVQKYPPDKYYYVLVGRSPKFLAVYMQEFEGLGFTQLPFSESIYTRLIDEHLDRALLDTNTLAQFEQILPGVDELGHRRILLIDYVSSGASLNMAKQFAKRTLRSRGQRTPMETLGLIAHDSNILYSPSIRLSLVPYPNLDASLADAFHKRFSPGGEYNPLQKKVPALEERLQLDDLRSQLGAFWSKDPAFFHLRRKIQRRIGCGGYLETTKD